MTSPERSCSPTLACYPPNLPAGSSRKTGNRRPGEKQRVPKGYGKTYGPLRTFVGLDPSLRCCRRLRTTVHLRAQARSHRCSKRNGLQTPYRNTKRAFCVLNVILGTNLPMTTRGCRRWRAASDHHRGSRHHRDLHHDRRVGVEARDFLARWTCKNCLIWAAQFKAS